jgi:hypothetical protein
MTKSTENENENENESENTLEIQGGASQDVADKDKAATYVQRSMPKDVV